MEREEIIEATVGPFKGVIYGESSYAVFMSGRLVLQTDERTVNSEEEIIKDLEEMAKIMRGKSA